MRKLALIPIAAALLALLASCQIPEAEAAPTLAVFGTGADGTVTFDGTTTILGLVPASDVYTMTRPIYCSSCTINAAAMINLNGNPFYDNGLLTINGNINYNGSGAAGGTPGASTGGIFYSATAAGGTTSAGVGGASAQAFCSPYLATTAGGAGGTASHAGTAGGTAVGGGGGGTTSGGGGSGGALTISTAGACYDLDMMLRTGRIANTVAMTFATGGGGGGGVGGAGGAGAGLAFVAGRVLAGSGSITATGGHGGNATTSGSGGGGGGGGGFVAAEYYTNTGTVSTSVAGGSAGSGSGAGSNGGSGGSGIVFKNCSTCLGINLSGDGT